MSSAGGGWHVARFKIGNGSASSQSGPASMACWREGDLLHVSPTYFGKAAFKCIVNFVKERWFKNEFALMWMEKKMLPLCSYDPALFILWERYSCPRSN